MFVYNRPLLIYTCELTNQCVEILDYDNLVHVPPNHDIIRLHVLC